MWEVYEILKTYETYTSKYESKYELFKKYFKERLGF